MSSCQKYIEQMNRYLDGELPAAQISQLLEHMEECPSCRARFEAMKVIAFEMRHMEVKPPAGLHDNIMQAVASTEQRRPRWWIKGVTTIAACAALLLLTSNSNFFHMAGNYLFSTDAIDSATGAAADQDEPETAEQQAPMLGDAVTGSAEPEGDGNDNTTAPAALPPEPQARGGGQQEEGTPVEPRAKLEAELPEKAAQGDAAAEEPQEGLNIQAADSGEEQKTDDSAGARAVPYSEQSPGVLAAEADSISDANVNNFRVPQLDTDEVFEFYCVALGTGTIPNVFPVEQTIHFPEKKCLYIYVDSNEFTEAGCAKLLRQAGFTVVDEPANLPSTEIGADYGLIVIYEYDVNK